MQDALVFNGLSALDSQQIRQNISRIPEVVSRIREAQKIWDRLEDASFDLANFINSDDQIFLSNIKLKSLATSVVQVGLYDRYLKTHKEPEFLIGISNGDSSLKVAAGKQSFSELITASQAVSLSRPSSPVQLADAPVLSGISLTEYSCYQRQPDENPEDIYTEIDVESLDVMKITQKMIDDFEVRRFVSIGPGPGLLNTNWDQYAMADIQILDSIDIDPLLSWFWAASNESHHPAAV